MRVATLADWRKSQIVSLKAQLRVVTVEYERLRTQVADINVLIASLAEVTLESRTTHNDSKSEPKESKPKRKLSHSHKRALMAGLKRWQAKKGKGNK